MHQTEDFPGGPVIKNPPANAEVGVGAGSIPGLGTKIPHTVKQLSPSVTLLILSTATQKLSLGPATRETPVQQQRPSAAKYK